MARYTAWNTVIDGAEKKHRSENATYKFLREWASGQPDGSVYVQEQYSDTWYPFEHHGVRSGMLDEARGESGQ
jgi:hypothetical protein